MADVLTPEQRTKCMSRIRGKDTRPELVVRRLIHSLGYRFRLHRADLPGTPDIVFVAKRKVVFVHGCYWHRHRCRYGQVQPATNSSFWTSKLLGNVRRDRTNCRRLIASGWQVLTLWECQIKNPRAIELKLKTFLES